VKGGRLKGFRLKAEGRRVKGVPRWRGQGVEVLKAEAIDVLKFTALYKYL